MTSATHRDGSDNELVEGLLGQATATGSVEAAMPFLLQAVSSAIVPVLKSVKYPKPDRALEALQQSGLDRLLIEGWMRGRVTYRMVDEHLNRLRDGFRARTVTPDIIKSGILAFDAVAQCLGQVSGKSGRFEYPVRKNHARDSLITFARALHR